jgi:hypothetical protein
MVNMHHRLRNNMKMNKNKGTERLIIVNVPELQKVARREVVVGDIRIATHKFLATAPFAIHVAMQ